MNNLYYMRNDCRLCGSGNVDVAVSLAPMPIATPNFSVRDVAPDDAVFTQGVPLDLYLCRDCGHLQILHIGNPELQYRDYVYTTSTSLGLREHFSEYAASVVKALQPSPGDLVVELGSNDGTLLRCFKKRGLTVLGVDPAVEIARNATESGIETIPAFFSGDIAEQIITRHGKAKIIVANNMLANVDDMIGFIEGVRSLLAPDGVFVFETQYGRDVFDKILLDTIYHEHLSYFNIKPLERFFAANGMNLFDSELIWTKGGSIRVFTQLSAKPRPVSDTVPALIAQEEKEGWYDLSTYTRFGEDIAAIRDKLGDIIAAEKAKGNQVAGYGVSVGTMALLPQFGLEDKLDFLVDDNPQRGPSLRGPGYDIPVHLPEALYEKNPGLVIIFAWRYAKPIMEKHAQFTAQGGKFAVPLPEVAIL